MDKPDLYDPKLNRSYAELAAHYGCLIDPARSRKPRDKARVERPMPYVRDSFWRGREFTSLEQMQAEAERWSAEIAGRRACRPLEGAAPAAVFEAVEKDALRPLPAEPFVLATWATGEDRPGHPCPGGPGAVLGAVAAHRQDRRRAGHRRPWCSSSSAGSWSRPTRARHAASRPTSATTRRRRSRSTCGPRPGAAARPPPSARPASRSSPSCWPITRCTGCASAQGVIGLADQARPGPAGGRLRESDRRRRPVLPDHQGHPGRRHRTRPAARGGRGRRRRRVPARPRLLRQRHPHARHRSPATRSAPPGRR